MTQRLAVELSSKSYPIHFLEAAAEEIAQEIIRLKEAGRPSVLITDAGVAEAQREFIERSFAGVPCFTAERGEKAKSIEVFGQAQEFLSQNRINRQGVLWVVGGGVSGDLGGFVAASYQCGIDFVQVPTTLLAMVDSSVGGKTGINLSTGKNLVGAFHHPLAVYIVPAFLRTLPAREFAAGMAEVIKYGLLGDVSLFGELEARPMTASSAELTDVIRRCCAMKAAVVRADEFERAPEGGRALLNLGHTFGHAIEQVSGYTAYLHGEAVAVGLVGAARLSQKLGFISDGDVARVERVLTAHALPTRLREALPVAALQDATTRDKKNRAGGVRFVVMNALGEAATCSGIDPMLVESVWRELGAV